MYCPLTGKPCPNPKTVEVCESVNGQPSRMNLCEACACHVEQLTGGKVFDPAALFEPEDEPPAQAFPPPFTKNGSPKDTGLPTTLFGIPVAPLQSPLPAPLAFFAKLMEQVEKHHNAEDPLTAPCPGCHSTLTDIYQKGRLGCPHCYGFFKQQVSPLIQHVHEGNLQHVGKVPKHHQKRADAEDKAKEIVMIQNSLAALDKKLAAAVKDERYEDAGKIRDQIKYLKTKMEG